MAKYIDAEKLFAEIEKMRKINRKALEAGHIGQDVFHGRAQTLNYLFEFIDSLQQEQPMPDSTKLIELWHEDKEKLKEKDFRNDPWRLAYNAFLCGFGRGVAVNKHEQPDIDLEAETQMQWDSFNHHLAKYDDEQEEVVWLNWNSFKDVCRDLYELGKPARKEPVTDCEDLEEAAEEYSNSLDVELQSDSPDCFEEIIPAFKAGAEWQKRQMLNDAVYMTKCNLSLGNHTEKVLAFGDRFPNGEKVCIIIVKEEE